MNNYELTSLISSALEEQEKNKVAEEIKALITSSEGEIINLSPLSEVNLGYPIKNEVKAYMLIINFKFNSEKIEELKNGLKNKKELLRFFLLTRTVPKRQTRTAPKRQEDDSSKIETDRKQKIKLKDIDKKIEEILSPSDSSKEISEKETEGNKQDDEFK